MRVGAMTATVPRLLLPSRADEHKVLHRRRSFIEPDHHTHLLLAAVHVGCEQFHQPLLCLESQQHLAQPFAIQFGRNQVGHAVNEERGA